MVVVTLDRAVGIAAARTVERGEDRFLDPGLADRSGHPDDPRIGPRAAGAGEEFERLREKSGVPFRREVLELYGR